MNVRKRQETGPAPPPLDTMAQWQQEEVDATYWEELLAADPVDVCRRSLGSYDPGGKAYRIRLLHQQYMVLPVQRSITRESNPSAGFQQHGEILFDEALVLLLYLLKAREIPLAGKQQTEKDLPGGEGFFRGPHVLARQPIIERFGRDAGEFRRAALSLGGRPLDFGDAAFRFQALPRIPLDYIFWAEDEEFPARLTIAFDPTVSCHLPLDVVWALVNLTTRRLVEAGSESS